MPARGRGRGGAGPAGARRQGPRQRPAADNGGRAPGRCGAVAAEAAAARRPAERHERATPATQYRFNWNTPFILSPHNPSIVWLGGNRLFKSYNQGDTWVASADLTKQVDRNTVTLMGVPGDRDAALEERRRRLVQHDHLDLRVAGAARRRLGRHRRWQSAGEPGRRADVHRSRQEPAGAAGRTICTGSRASTRRTSTPARRTSRSTVIAATISSRTSSSRATTARPSRASPATCRRYGNVQVIREDPKNRNLLYVGHRIRVVHLARRRQAVEEVHEQLPDGAHRRHSGPSAGQRSDRRDARTQHLDCRRHHAAAADERRRCRRRTRLSSTSARRLHGSTISSATSRSAARRSSSARTRRAARRSTTT